MDCQSERALVKCSTQQELEMENQHQKIKGYRDLSKSEIDTMNKIKEKAQEVGDLVESLRAKGDDRWLVIAQTQLQQGFMALTRAVAKPDFF